VARVLDVTEERARGDFEAQLLERHPLDGIGQRFAEADGATRDVPEALARASFTPGKEDARGGGDDDLHGEARYAPIDRLVFVLRQGAPCRRRHPNEAIPVAQVVPDRPLSKAP
jgi:hypothetical protein